MFAVYVLFCLVAALYMARKTDQPILGFIFLFWLLASPTLTTQFKLYIPGVPFDLRINRILFFALAGFLFYALLRDYPANWRSNKLYFYEKTLFVYLGLVFLSLIYNQSNIEFKTIFSVTWEILTFILVYFISKRYIRQGVYNKLLKAILILAVITSIISIIQFFISNDLYRISPEQTRMAFGGKLRSTGVFQNEYEQGYFLILAIFVLLSTPRFKLRLPLLGVFVLGVVLAFHRVDMVILAIVFLLYFLWFKPKFFMLFFSGLLLAGSFLGGMYVVYEDSILKSSVVKERLSQDSGGRLNQFSSVIDKMPDKPLGYGAYKNTEYVQLMIRAGSYISYVDDDGEWHKQPLTVHNGYLAVGTKYGPVTMLVFIAFMLSLLIQFKKLSLKQNPRTFIPFIMIMIWALANMTNGIEHFRAHFVLLLGILCGSYVGLYHTNMQQLIAERCKRQVSD